MLISKIITVLLMLTFGNIYFAAGQQLQPDNNNAQKVFKIDTLSLDSIVVEMEKALKLTADQKPKVEVELKKYLIKRMTYASAKYEEPEEWMSVSNNKLFDFSQSLEKILNEEQIDCFWAMKPSSKDDNIWWNIFVVY